MVRRGFGCRAPAAVSSVASSTKLGSHCRAKFARLLLTTGVVSVGLSLASFDAAAVTGCTGTTAITCTSIGNNYTSGIPFTTNTLDLTLIVQGDVVVTSTAAGVKIGNSDTDNDIFIDLYSGALITTTGSSISGIRVDDAASVYLNSSAQITTSGSDAEGVFIDDTTGNVTVITAGEITTNGTKSRGVLVSDTVGDVTIISSSNITTKSNVSAAYGSGIWVSKGSGDVSVTSTGDIETYGGRSRGILVTDSGNVTVNSSGDITTHFNSNYNAGILTARNDSVDVTATGTITTAGSPGIEIATTYGDVSVTLSGDIIAGTSFTSLPTATSNSRGISVDNSAGAVDVYLSQDSSITTYGASAHGVYVDDTVGNVAIDLRGAITTNGNSSRGVYVTDTGGDVTILHSGTIATAGTGAAAIRAENTSGDVIIQSSGSVVTSGDSSSGIEVDITDGAVDVYLSQGSGITTYGANAHGVYIEETIGNVTVDLRGAITTNGNSSRGVYATDTTGNVTISHYGSIATAGTGAAAIRAENTSGDVIIQSSGSVATSGDSSSGIEAVNTTGSVDISSTGTIATSGAAAHGIYVYLAGPTSVEVTGTIAAGGSGSDGIQLKDVGTAEVDISGSVSGGSGTGAGLRLSSLASTDTPTVAIRGSLGALSDIAIVDGDDAVTINNSGTITGTVDLGSGDDVLNNESSGTWYLRSGDNAAVADFGAGTDSVVNNGTLRQLKGTQLSWQGSLTNLESFTNSGTIDLADGHAGDTLSISGNFVSNGGTLKLDTVLDDGATPQTDMLQLDTVTRFNGPTHIQIQNVGGQGSQTSGNGIQIVDVVTSSVSDAFDLAKRTILGAYEYTLAQVGQDWYLQSGVFEGTAEYPAVASGAVLAWKADLGFLHNRLRGSSWDSGGGQPRIEPVAYTGDTAQKTGPWFNVLGAGQSVSSDAAYKQRITKLEAGFDGEIETGRSRIVLGAFAGMGQHEQNFTDSTSKTTSDSALAGAYGKYRWGGFYGDGILKYEHHWADFSGAATDDQQTAFGLNLFGLSLESGYRLTGRYFYVQPHAGVDYVHAKADSFEDASGATVELSDGDSLAGEVGARVGMPLPHGELYVDAGIAHEFLGEMQADVSGLTFSNDLPGTVALVSAGLTMRAAEDRLLLTLETGYAMGPDAEEFTATGNFWIKF
jgi:outer membrane autotransporter protein